MANPNSLLHFNALKNPNGVGALEEARPFKCPVCLRTFKKKCGLKSHEASFHVGDDLWKIMFTPFSSWENKVETKVASRGKVFESPFSTNPPTRLFFHLPLFSPSWQSY